MSPDPTDCQGIVHLLTMKSPALLNLRSRCTVSPIAVSGLVLVVFALVLRALIPMGYMPSGTGSSPFELSVCFSDGRTSHLTSIQAGNRLLADVPDDTAPGQQALHPGACIFSATPAPDSLSYGSSFAAQSATPRLAIFSSQACANRASVFCGPPLGSRAPPVS